MTAGSPVSPTSPEGLPLAANLGFLFTEVPFLERFAQARQAGFAAVEIPWPPVDADTVVAAATTAEARVIQLNMDAGNLAGGDRGWPNDPDRRGEWRDAFLAALALARRLGTPAINVLAGNRVRGRREEEQRACLEDNLGWALSVAETASVVLLLEVLNDRDTPDYLVTDLDDAVALIRRTGSAALRLQFDTYHVGALYGPAAVPPRFTAVAPLVGHVQIADVPGRHEPGTGRIDFPRLISALGLTGYRGWVSAEYLPSTTTDEGLGWRARLRS